MSLVISDSAQHQFKKMLEPAKGINGIAIFWQETVMDNKRDVNGEVVWEEIHSASWVVKAAPVDEFKDDGVLCVNDIKLWLGSKKKPNTIDYRDTTFIVNDRPARTS